MAFGPGESRFVEEKRHYAKPIPISNLVLLDRERCVLCDRCTRFAKRGGRRPAHPLHRAGQPDPGAHLPRRALLVVLQRQHRADLPGGRAHRHALPLQGPPLGPRAAGVHLHVVRGGVPHHGAVVPQPAAALPGRRRRRRQLGLDVRPGPLRLRGRSTTPTAWPRPACAAATGPTRASWRPPGRWRCGAAAFAIAQAAATPGRRRWRCWAGPGAPTRTPTRGPSWPRASSAPTTSTPSWATASTPSSCSGCRRPPSTEACAATTVLLLGPDLKEELPVLFLRLRHAAAHRDDEGGGARPAGQRPDRVRERVAAVPARASWRRWCAPCWATGRPPPSAPTRTRSPGPHAAGRGARWWSWWGAPRWPSRPTFVADAAAAVLAAHPERPLPARRCGAATCAARWSWAWRPACCPAGSPWPRAAERFREAWGAVPEPSRAGRHRHPHRRGRGPRRAAWCCWAPTR